MSFWTGTNWERDDPAPPTPARPSRRRHVLEALAEGGLIAVLVGALAFAFAPVSGPANSIAGTGHADAASKASSVWIVQPAAARTTGLSYGSSFVVGYSTNTREPWAHAVCYANSTSILAGPAGSDGSIWGSWFSLWDGGPSPQNFVLGASVSPTWTGGGADCKVDLVKVSGKYLGALGFSKETVLASTRFVVAP